MSVFENTMEKQHKKQKTKEQNKYFLTIKEL